MTDITDVTRQIKILLIEDMQIGMRIEDIPDDYSLLENGLALDSILIAELITRIEDYFNIQVDSSAIEPALFTNIARLATFIETQRSSTHLDSKLDQEKVVTC